MPFQPNNPDQKRQNSSFQSLFELTANRLGVGTEVKAIRVCHEARKTIPLLLPDHAPSIDVISFRDGTLNLRASSSSLQQKLFTKKHLLQESINQTLGAGTVDRITIRTA